MQGNIIPSGENRRVFLKTLMSGGICLGLGCQGIAALESMGGETGHTRSVEEFNTPSGYSYEQVFNFAFRNWFIRYMKGLQAEIGEERFLSLLKKVGDDLYRDAVKARFEKLAVKDVKALIENFWEPTRESRLWGTCMTIDIIKKSQRAGTVKMSDCLVAKVFRENDAGDIGYAAICHADFAVAEVFNPEIRMERNHCLMKGDDFCLFEYTM
jgi:hypothetical protein